MTNHIFKRTFATFGVALLVLAGAVPALAQVTDVRVVDYNIARRVGANGPNTTGQLDLAYTIDYLRPDVLTIQELGGNTQGWNRNANRQALINFISTNTKTFGVNPVEGVNFFVYVSESSDNFIGNAIVSRFPLLVTTTYGGGIRGLPHALVDLPGTTDMGVFTSHFKALSDNNAVGQRQGASFEVQGVLSNWLTNNPDKVAVATGDYNETEDPEDNDNWANGNIGDMVQGFPYRPITNVKAAGFIDPIPVSRNGDNDTIRSGTSNPNARFDYNLYSANRPISWLSGEVFNSLLYSQTEINSINSTYGISLSRGSSGAASDHLPVLAVYRVTSPVPEPMTIAGLGAGVAFLITRRRNS